MKTVTLINICGTERSGSTLLDLMLGNDDDAFSCGEVFAKFRPHRRHHFTPVCGCGESPCPVWSQLEELRPREFHAGAAARLGVGTVIDSSKDLSWLIDANCYAAAAGLRVVNLVIYKSPVQLAHSFWKRQRSIAGSQQQFLAYYGYLMQTRLPFLSVSYDELAQSPETVLADLCDRLELPYTEGKERFWERTQHHLFGSPSVRASATAGQGALSYRTDFPSEFLAAFEAEAERYSSEMDKVTGQLRKHDYAVKRSPSLRKPARGLYPRWYYRRRLMLAYRRYFPMPVPVSAGRGQ